MFLLKWIIFLAKPFERYSSRLIAMYRGLRDQMDSMKKLQPSAWDFKQTGNVSMGQSNTDQDMRPIMQEKVNLLYKGGLKADTYNFMYKESRKA